MTNVLLQERRATYVAAGFSGRAVVDHHLRNCDLPGGFLMNMLAADWDGGRRVVSKKEGPAKARPIGCLPA